MHILVIYFTVVPAFFFVLIKDFSKRERESKPKNDYEGCKNESGLAPGELAPGPAAGGAPGAPPAPRRARAGGRAREPRDLESLSRGRASRRIRSHELIIDKILRSFRPHAGVRAIFLVVGLAATCHPHSENCHHSGAAAAERPCCCPGRASRTNWAGPSWRSAPAVACSLRQRRRRRRRHQRR